MIALLRSELRKLLSTQVWFWLLLGSIGLAVLGVVGQILTEGAANNPAPRLSTAAGQRNLFAQSSAGYAFAIVLGILALTTEYRHLTVTPTYLATPRRNRVVAAKLVTYGLVGLTFAVACVVVVVAVAVPWLNARNIDVSLTANGIPQVLLASVAVVTIYGVVGVGVGALIRNQVAAVVLTLAFLFIAEPLLGALPWVRNYYKFFPGGAANALANVSSSNVELLEPWQGGLLLAGYGVAFAVLGALLTIRRDIT